MRYRIDASRVTYREFRTEASPPIAALGWLLTRLRLPLPSSASFPAVDDIGPHRTPSANVPAEIETDLAETRSELEALGFRGTIYHHFVDPTNRTEIYYASFLHQSGKAIALVSHRVFSANTPPKKFIETQFITPLGQGATLATCSGKGDLETPEVCLDEYVGKANTDEAWRRHKERLADPAHRESARAVGDGREVLYLLEQRHKAIIEPLVERGVLVPTKEAKPVAAAGLEGESTAPGDTDALLLAEVRKLETKPPAKWTTSLLVLVGTIALFLGLGGIAWSWKFAMLLVPILLVHEAGHYLAMKLFDYRNVQMFFIPLFGAAVTGRHYDVPGWKRVVTSLMGPVPGIGIGIGLGIVALVQQQDLLLEAAVLTIVLNGFNLLPALPLDGGWVLHGLLFSRHAFFDLLFRLVAICLLFFLAFAGGTRITMYIGIAMLVGLPMAFHLSRITDRLRASPEPLDPPLGGQAPASAIARIGSEIDKAYPKGIDVRNKSQLVLQVYENVNSRPPGWVATLTLGAVYVGSFLVACVGALFFGVAQQADLAQLLAEGAFGPQTPIAVEEITATPNGLDPADESWEETLVVNFADAATAQREFLQLDDSGQAALLGASILKEVAPDVTDDQRDAWFDRYEAIAEGVFVADTDSGVSLEVSAIAPTLEEAETIQSALSGYFAVPAALNATPPWDLSRRITPEQKVARETLMRLSLQEWMEDVDATDLYEEIDEATRRGRKQDLEKLYLQVRERNEAAREAYLRSLRDEPAGEIDLAVVAAFEAAIERQASSSQAAEATEEDEPDAAYALQFVEHPDPAEWAAGVADRLGVDDAAALNSGEPRYSFADANGPMISVSASLDRLPADAVALVRWLDSQGCVDVKYRLSGRAW